MRKDKMPPLLPEGAAASACASSEHRGPVSSPCCISGPQSLCEPWQRQAHPWDPRRVGGVRAGGSLRGQQHPRSSPGHTGRASLRSRRFCVPVSGVHPSMTASPGPDGGSAGSEIPSRLPPVATDLRAPDGPPWPLASGGLRAGRGSRWGQKQLQAPLVSPVTHVRGSSLPEHLGSAGALPAPQPSFCSWRLLSRRRITETPAPVKSAEPPAAGSHRGATSRNWLPRVSASSSRHGGQGGGWRRAVSVG